MCLAASSCNPAEQESGNITNSFLHAARANALCHTRLQTRIAGVLAQIDQRSRSISSADFTTQIRRYSLRTADSYALFCEIELFLQYRALFVGNFPRSRPAHHTSRPLKPPYLLYKTKGFAPESVFTRKITHSQTLLLPNYLIMGLTWCGWHDGVNANHDHHA